MPRGRFAHVRAMMKATEQDFYRRCAAEQIEVGRTYRTMQAIWTVTDILPSGMVKVTRDDGRTATYGLRDFASWVVEKVS